MYAAKRRSAAAPLLYDPSIDAASAQTLSLLTELRHAVEHDELRLYLQPKLALDTGRVVGAEALVRWQHPQRGLVPPTEFIPFAEQTGFIRTLTLWVFEEAARHWRALQRRGHASWCSRSTSRPATCSTRTCRRSSTRCSAQHRVPAEAFCLEITESAIMDDPQRALGHARAAERAGLQAVDRRLRHRLLVARLPEAPAGRRAEDRQVVRAATWRRDADDAKIVRSTIDLAHNLGPRRWSPRASRTRRSGTCCASCDCDEAQGYYMGRPMPVDEFLQWSAAAAALRVTRAGDSAVLH